MLSVYADFALLFPMFPCSQGKIDRLGFVDLAKAVSDHLVIQSIATE